MRCSRNRNAACRNAASDSSRRASGLAIALVTLLMICNQVEGAVVQYQLDAPREFPDGLIPFSSTFSDAATCGTVSTVNATTDQTAAIDHTATSGTNARLATLTLSSGPLSPAFDGATNDYTAAVGSNTTSVTLAPVAGDTNAVVMCRINNGAFTPVVPGATSTPMALSARLNVIEVKVIANDGATTNIYSLHVSRSIASAVITRISQQADRTCLVHFNGTPGILYTVQTSTNLVSWTSLANVMAETNGAFSYLDTGATNAPHRFYRLLCP